MKRNADLKINDNDMWNRNCEPFLSTWVHPRVFSGVFFCLIFSFLCNALFIVVCTFVLLLLAIVLSVIMVSEYFWPLSCLSLRFLNTFGHCLVCHYDFSILLAIVLYVITASEYFWPLSCLSLRLLNTFLVSSNFPTHK
jgi:hypothetical protein